MTDAALVQLAGITKTFPGVKALDEVDFGLRRGEVHVLLGENGAGKSTLVKVLCGAYQPDSGEIKLEGEKVAFSNTREAQRAGISIIYQEFNLVPYLNVAQNVFLGRFPMRKRLPFLVDHEAMHQETRAILDSLDVDVDVKAEPHSLGIAQQQMVEVAKALSIDAKILIMDEPTAALTDREIERLFTMIDRLRDRGIGIIYISHRLNEVHEVGDRVTVLRDGKLVGTRNVEDVEVSELVEMMVGRSIDEMFARSYQERGEEALRVEHISSDRCGLEDCSLVAHKGEIVGLAGLVGSGRTDLFKAIFGAQPLDAGEVYVFGRKVTGWPPSRLVDLGVGLLPEDRKEEGLALNLSVANNIVMASLQRLFPRSVIYPARETKVVDEFIDELRIQTPGRDQAVRFLSGGNQQKVVVAKWLATDSELYIFDEPTRGIDVGAKVEIHELMDELVAQGAAVVMASSDLPEILNMSDRVYVMHERKIVAELSRDEATAETIIAYAMGHLEEKEQQHEAVGQ